MKELSLHILDIARNSIRAEATLIQITIEENDIKNLIEISIKDNGKGMNKETLEQVTNPFFTTRDVRNVGLGIPLFKATAERCNGYFSIKSNIGIGTEIKCTFEKNHIDRAPLGNMGDTIMAIVGSLNDSELQYVHKCNGNVFEFNTTQIKEILDGVEITSSEVLLWIKEFVDENLYNISKKNNI